MTIDSSQANSQVRDGMIDIPPAFNIVVYIHVAVCFPILEGTTELFYFVG